MKKIAILSLIALAACTAQVDRPATLGSQTLALNPACEPGMPFTPCLISGGGAGGNSQPPPGPELQSGWMGSGGAGAHEYYFGSINDNYCVVTGEAGIRDGIGSGFSLRGYLPGDVPANDPHAGQWVLVVASSSASDNIQAKVACTNWGNFFAEVPFTPPPPGNRPPPPGGFAPFTQVVLNHTLHEIVGVSTPLDGNLGADEVGFASLSEFCPLSALVGSQTSLQTSQGVGEANNAWILSAQTTVGQKVQAYSQCVSFSVPNSTQTGPLESLAGNTFGANARTVSLSNGITQTTSDTGAATEDFFCALATESGNWQASCAADLEDPSPGTDNDFWSVVSNCYGGAVVGAQMDCIGYQ